MNPNHNTEKFSPVFTAKEIERTGVRSRKGLWEACVLSKFQDEEKKEKLHTWFDHFLFDFRFMLYFR